MIQGFLGYMAVAGTALVVGGSLFLVLDNFGTRVIDATKNRIGA